MELGSFVDQGSYDAPFRDALPAGVPAGAGLAWSCWFLPYIEEQSLFSLMDLKMDMRAPPNWQADLSGPTNRAISTYLCPSMARHQTQRGMAAAVDAAPAGAAADDGELDQAVNSDLDELMDSLAAGL